MIKYTTIALFFILNLFNFSFSQENDINKLKQDIANTPYVIEGEVINVEHYPVDENFNRLYAKDSDESGNFILKDGVSAIGCIKTTIQILKIYKGNIDTKTIEIVTYSKHLDIYKRSFNGKDTLLSRINRPSHGNVDNIIYTSKNIGEQKLLFLSKRIDSDYFKHNIKVEYSILTPNQRNFQKNRLPNFKDYYASGNGKVFYSKEEFNIYFKQFPSLNIDNPKIVSSAEKKNAGLKESLIKKENPTNNYNQNLQNYSDWLLRSEEQLRHSNNDNRSNETLELEIKNPRLTGANNDPWLEFDIIATETAGNGVYFDNCLIRIEYNTSAFGSNIVANNNVIITRATNFNTTTYTNPQTNSIH